MKKYILQRIKILPLLAAAILMVFTTNIATAKVTASAKDEKKLSTEITTLDKDATMPNGDRVVMDRLSKEFKVPVDKISALKDKNLGYGDIAAIYAFADKMSGGITDDNVNKVVSLRESKTGWAMIAKDVNVDLGHVAKKVGSIEKDAHKDIKKASKETTGTAGGGGGGLSGKDRSAPLYQ